MGAYKECPNCGAHLDPGERCDCQQPRKLVTKDDWRAAGDFDKAAKPGDAVEESIVDDFIDVLPPLVLRADFVQCGEPVSMGYDPERGRWASTYTTFERVDGIWIYRGNCFPGKTKGPVSKTTTADAAV